MNPLSVKEIDKEAFAYNYGEFTLSYEGSVVEWNNITLHNRWNATSSLKVVHCKDGDIILN